jgi:hypothetical protein
LVPMLEPGDRLDPPEPPGWPRLREFLGDDLFYSVASVSLPRYVFDSQKGGRVEAVVSDEDLRVLRDFATLRCVALEFQPITDAGLEHLRGLRRLKDVDLYGTKLTDDAVRTLVELPNLERLNVGGTQIDPHTLTCLCGRTKLKWLALSTDQIQRVGGGRAVKALFPNVEILRCDMKESGGVSIGSP